MLGIESIWHWLVLLLVVMLVFGTKKLRNIGEDVGAAVKGFRDGMRDSSEEKPAAPAQVTDASGKVIEGEVKEKTRS